MNGVQAAPLHPYECLLTSPTDSGAGDRGTEFYAALVRLFECLLTPPTDSGAGD